MSGNLLKIGVIKKAICGGKKRRRPWGAKFLPQNYP
jgi:hypothetical protein